MKTNVELEWSSKITRASSLLLFPNSFLEPFKLLRLKLLLMLIHSSRMQFTFLDIFYSITLFSH